MLLAVASILAASFAAAELQSCAYPSVTHCVRSTSDACYNPCCTTAVPCKTLMEYVEQQVLATNNATFLFLTGNHSLQKTAYIKNASNLKFQGEDGNVTIVCSGWEETGLFFGTIVNLTINNLQVMKCAHRAGYLFLAVEIEKVINLSLNAVVISNTTGIGLKLVNLYGYSHISNTTIEYSSGQNLALYCYNDTHYNGSVSTVLLENSVFQYGAHGAQVSTKTSNNKSIYNHSYASGVHIHIACNIKMNIMLKKVNATHNSAEDSGGNIAIQYSSYSKKWLVNISIIDCFISYGDAGIGGGLYFNAFRIPHGEYHNNNSDSLNTGSLLDTTTVGNNMAYTAPILVVSRTRFLKNKSSYGAGVYIRFRETEWPMVAIVTFRECHFEKQSVRDKDLFQHGGVAVHVRCFQLPIYVPHKNPLLLLEFLDCNFTENSTPNPHAHIPSSLYAGESHNGVLYIQGIKNITLSGCRFVNNNSSGIVAIQSWMFLLGENLMHNNTGVRGGGIVLCSRSIIFLHENSTLKITENKVTDYGGGIYVESECDQDIPHCFFQVNSTHSFNRTRVFLVNNSAPTGQAVYGGMVDHCVIYMNITQNYTTNVASKIFRKIFYIEPEEISSVASNPSTICFCDGLMFNKSFVNNKTIDKNIVPGMTVKVYVMLLGQRNSPTPGTVKAYTSDSCSIKKDLKETSQDITRCTELQYQVFSDQENVSGVIQLVVAGGSLEYSGTKGQEYPAEIRLNIEKCPLGSQLNKTVKRCQYLYDQIYITDHIEIKSNPPVWIGYKTLEPLPNTTKLIKHKFCPLEYCVQKKKAIKIKTKYNHFDQDAQCAPHRTGLLCGKCRQNYSLGFGSSECLPGCNTAHRYLQYIRVIGLVAVCAVAGVLLVILLTLLNITVAEGTLNGLIFYANIVQVNIELFFPPDTHTRPWTGFIAWLNLDFGISVCFYDGMDAYTKTWLQFIFPLYLWFLAGGIIYFSRNSRRVSKLAGTNSVKVLATLFLLSFGKLSRTVIAAMFFANVKSHDGTVNISVWLLDPNIHYLHGKHIVLFVGASVAGMVGFIYALTLTFIQCLRRSPNNRVFGWVQRLKPLLDAYTGPYKVKYHFWTGLLLLVRIGLFTSFALNFENNPTLNFTLIITISAILLVAIQPGIYKNSLVGFLESSFYLDLILFSAIMLFMLNKFTHYRTFTAHFFGALALVKFLGIIAYHAYKHWVKSLRESSMFQERLWVWGYGRTTARVHPVQIQRRDSEESSSEDETGDRNECDLSQGAWSTPEYREPLIMNGSV